MLFWFWPTIFDVDPTSKQHWVNISYLLGCHHKTSDFTRIASQQTQKHLHNICTTSAQCLRRWPNIVHMLYKCFVFAVFLSNRKHSINVIRILAHRLRRRPDVNATSAQRLVFAGFLFIKTEYQLTPHKDPTLYKFCITTFDIDPALSRHWTQVQRLLREHTQRTHWRRQWSSIINSGSMACVCCLVTTHSNNTLHWPKVGSMVGQRRRQWTSFKTTSMVIASCWL